MPNLREAATQALKALEADNSKLWPSEKRTAAITALKAALAEPVQEPSDSEHLTTGSEHLGSEQMAEPVAWRWGYRSVTTGEMDWRGYVEIPSHPNLRSPAIIMEPLYAAPPQRKPLTDEEIAAAANSVRWSNQYHVDFARAIERAHQIGEQP